MSQYPRACSSNEKEVEYGQDPEDLRNQRSVSVRKTPLKARNLQPPEKPIRKRRIPKPAMKRTSNEPREDSGVIDVSEKSNGSSFDCKDIGPNRDIEDSEIENLSVQEDVISNSSESNVDQCGSSGGDVLKEIFDAQVMNTKLELSEPSANFILRLLEEELAKKGEGSENLVVAIEILKDALATSKDCFTAASPPPALETSGELANLDECEQLLQEMEETIRKLTEMVKNHRALLANRLSEYYDEEIDGEWYETEYEEELGNRYSFPTFLANYLLVAAFIFVFVLPPILLNTEKPKFGVYHPIMAWLNSTV